MSAENARLYISRAAKIIKEQGAGFTAAELAVACASLAQAEAVADGLKLPGDDAETLAEFASSAAYLATQIKALIERLDGM